MNPDVAIVHDYLTQRGGAEKVVAAMTRAFPGVPVYTSLYEPDSTFDEFRALDIRTSWMQGFHSLRNHHRLGLPLYAPTFSAMHIDAKVTIASTSGWAHGVRTTGRKIAYCYTPARWLYQAHAYLGENPSAAAAISVALMRRSLMAWDRVAAASADRFIAISSVVRDRIRDAYDIDAEVLHPPCTIDAGGEQSPLEGIEEGFWLSVGRLMPYKNVTQIVEAFAQLPNERLLVVGDGPEHEAISKNMPRNVVMAGGVSDATLRWAYANCRGLVAASFEDFGLTPLEAAAFGRPAVALAWGGFPDTIIEGETGVFFDAPEPAQIADAVRDCASTQWNEKRIRDRAGDFSEKAFARRLRQIVEEEAVRPGIRSD